MGEENPILKMRSELTGQIREIEAMVAERPANGAELTLALRHLQDARMRLGVAMAMADGKDPWAS